MLLSLLAAIWEENNFNYYFRLHTMCSIYVRNIFSKNDWFVHILLTVYNTRHRLLKSSNNYKHRILQIDTTVICYMFFNTGLQFCGYLKLKFTKVLVINLISIGLAEIYKTSRQTTLSFSTWCVHGTTKIMYLFVPQVDQYRNSCKYFNIAYDWFSLLHIITTMIAADQPCNTYLYYKTNSAISVSPPLWKQW